MTCDIQQRNEEFELLSKEEKAVALAYDVLSLIRQPEVNVSTQAGYFKIPQWLFDEVAKVGLSLRTVWKKITNTVKASEGGEEYSCTVCGIGALFMAHINRLDSYTIEDEYGDAKIGRKNVVKTLGRVFSPYQLDLIEAAFEMDPTWSKEANNEDLSRAIKFGQQFAKYDDKNRLSAIMENIINNKGEFKP